VASCQGPPGDQSRWPAGAPWFIADQLEAQAAALRTLDIGRHVGNGSRSFDTVNALHRFARVSGDAR